MPPFRDFGITINTITNRRFYPVTLITQTLVTHDISFSENVSVSKNVIEMANCEDQIRLLFSSLIRSTLFAQKHLCQYLLTIWYYLKMRHFHKILRVQMTNYSSIIRERTTLCPKGFNTDFLTHKDT